MSLDGTPLEAVAAVPASSDSTDQPVNGTKEPMASTFLHSPPDSNNAVKTDGSDSELSDPDETMRDADIPPEMPAKTTPEEDEDIGEVLPDHWSGTVPVFRPTMEQFKDFKKFMHKVDSYGMMSGIIKIIPPEEWKNSQPKLDEMIKQIRVREPIKQDIMGSNGTYRQVNILHGRSYNLPQWRSLCDQSEHQPPARRGERRANIDKPKAPRPKPAPKKPADPTTPKKRGRGRPPKNKPKAKPQEAAAERPMTPESPRHEPSDKQEGDTIMETVEKNDSANVSFAEPESPAPVRRMGAVKPAKESTQSVSARRKYSRREGSAAIDEAAFKDFEYKMDVSEFTAERCEELERAYWKTLTYAPPLYGADMMGTLFDEKTDIWNLNKLPNLLDVLGTKIPGVNTAYLYLGMWKATFAWHLEDVDLYSINYVHFGAPKQWYSISQADAPRFEKAMKDIWPQDAKSCSQFLRHKGYLISPQHLLSRYGIKVNKCLSYPGEFVVTYPYGYHSGYNLGYNCAEAVNFALDAWLPMGKIAKRCECAQAQDSVWIDVYEIERKLRGEETDYEYSDEELEEDITGLPSPPETTGVKFSKKHAPGERKPKKVKTRAKPEPPCCLCPNDIAGMELLETPDGRKTHRLCALYTPETYIDTEGGKELVFNTHRVHKDRLDLRCLYCRSKRGACFQCSQKKCARAYHASCAAAAGVFVEDQKVPVFGEDGVEYKEQAFEFSCRFHRAKRDKKLTGEDLENDDGIINAGQAAKTGDIVQFQFLRGDIFAGVVVENRPGENMLLADIIPSGDRVEIEWKWLLLPDASDFHLPKASPNAIPMPASQVARDRLNGKRGGDDRPRKDDTFCDGYTWADFQLEEISSANQSQVDLAKSDQLWYYLGAISTDGRAKYTEDLATLRHNDRANFLATVPKPARPANIPKTSASDYSFVHHSAPGLLTKQEFSSALVTPHPSSRTYSKYPFFQVNNNRDPTRYRSPYAPISGFNVHVLFPGLGKASSKVSAPLSTAVSPPVKMTPKARPKPVQQAKTYIIPEKESPVPLPPGFLKILAASPTARIAREQAISVFSAGSKLQIKQEQQEFADVPGSESMELMERMMHNIRRMSHGQH